jgi:hypothetical protein
MRSHCRLAQIFSLLVLGDRAGSGKSCECWASEKFSKLALKNYLIKRKSDLDQEDFDLATKN